MKKFAVLALAVLMIAGMAATAFAAQTIWGRINSVDAKNNSLKAWNGQLGTYTVKINNFTKITLDGKTAKLSEIPQYAMLNGDAVKQTDGTYLASKLTVTSCTFNQVSGTVSSIDSANRTFTISSNRLGSIKVRLANDAKITKNGAEVKFADVKKGDMLRFDATKQDDGTYFAKSATYCGGCGGGNGGGCGGGRGR